MIKSCSAEQLVLFDTKTKLQSKLLGQFFTESPIASYMASMLQKVNSPDLTRILDAGAGAGVLTVSAAYRCLSMGNDKVHATLYEIDKDILPALEDTMERVVLEFHREGGEFSYEIRNADFVLTRPDKHGDKYHVSIINPPYFRYNSKRSRYSGATADLFKGDPNIYASFMAVVSACLVPGGQMIAIVPRSFTNGLYFKGFRRYMLSHMSLERVHTFKSRNRLFRNMGVLQENIICKYVKKDQIPVIKICSSISSEDLSESEINRYQNSIIIDRSNSHNIIRVPETAADGHILQLVEKWSSSFVDNGYYISTGPVVEFRTREFITTSSQAGAVPLMRMHNVKAFTTEWTQSNRKNASFVIKKGHEKHTTINSVYVLLKRFSTKDERRRLVAGVHDPTRFAGNLIALENHINYIGFKGGVMGLTEAFGLAGLLNSTIMDRYFRAISGNTQVNATEIRLIKLPDRKSIIGIGSKIQHDSNNIQQGNLDDLVNSSLGI